MEFSSVLAQAVQTTGLMQKEIAAQIGVSQSMLTMMSKGERAPTFKAYMATARLAKIDKRRAALDWMMVATGGAANDAVREIKRSLPMLSVCLALLPIGATTDAHASTESARAAYTLCDLLIRRLRKVFFTIFRPLMPQHVHTPA